MSDEARPVPVEFADLFDHLGTNDLGYSTNAARLSGRNVVIQGYLAHTHAHGPAPSALMLVDQPGLCPDCSPVPAAVITLQGVGAFDADGVRAVSVTGRLDFGFRVDDGVASFVRIEQAAISPLAA